MKRRDGAGHLRRLRPQRHEGVVSVARWRRDPEKDVVPDWQLEEWVAADPRSVVNGWLDDLYDQNPDRWAVAVTLLSVPSYAASRG